jgi:MFS superfamily sulfate permease-like transporter
MAYAGIVGVPPIMGLYTIVPPLIAYALLGTSRLLVVGPDTATGLISALTVGAIAAQATAEFNTLTSTIAILIGAFFLLFGALRMGWVAAFIPTPVMRGFIEGLVGVAIIGQVPHLLGIEGTSGNFFAKLWSVVEHLPDASLAPVLTGLLSLVAMLLLRHLAPRVPAALVVAVSASHLGCAHRPATGTVQSSRMMIPSTGMSEMTSVTWPLPLVLMSINLSPASSVWDAPSLPTKRKEPDRQITSLGFGAGCRQAEAAEQQRKPQPTPTKWAIGCVEWLAEQKKSG